MNPATPPRIDFLEVGDASIYHEIRGEGPLVLLVGSPMDAASFEPFAELLATDHMVVTIDPRGDQSQSGRESGQRLNAGATGR